jgi:hypothetical protein
MASYEELLEATGKEYLTPTEFRILNERERSGTLEDMFMGSGKEYAGMLRDLYKSNIEGDEKYDRDWNWSDAMTPAYDAMSLLGFRPAAAALKSKFAVGAAKGAGKGLQKGYNLATGAKRGAASKAAGGKKTLDAPDGKPGMMQKAGTAIKNNPIKSTLAGAAGLGGAAAGVNAILPDAPEGLDPLEKNEEVEIADPAPNQNLDNPNGQMAMTPEGQAQAAMQAKANSRSPNKKSGTRTIPDLAQGRVQAEADRQADEIIKHQKKASDQNNFLRDRYDATGGRRAGAWDRLSEAQKDLAARNYGQNSFYDSNPNATGGTAVSDIARAELGMPSMEEQRLADLDARVEQQRMSNMGYGVAADSENYQGALPSMSKEDFSKKSGMQNEGTGIVNTTLDGKGPVTTLEMGGQFDKAGGLETAKPHLSAAQQVNLERQLDRPGVFNDQFGQEQEMSKDTVRMTSDEQDYSDANFQNRDDALAYLNRGASLDEPAPEAPAPEAPAPEEEEDGWDWSDAAKGAGLIGGGLLLSRTKPGRKMIQKGFDMFGKKSYPPGRNKILQDAAKRNATAGTSNVSGGLGRPGSMQQMGYQGGTPQSVGRVIKVNPWSTARNARPTPQPQANPWASTGNMRPPTPTPQSVGRSAPPPPQANPWASTGNMKPNYSGGTPQSVGGPAPTQNLSNPWASTGNMKPRAATPQDAGFNSRVGAMGRQDLIRGVGSPRTADGRRVATNEELRRLYRAMNQQIF